MIFLTFYDTGGDLVESFTVSSRDAAVDAMRCWVDRAGRSAFAEGGKQEDGWRGGYWHDGQVPVWTNTAGPARTARKPFFCETHRYNPPDGCGFALCPFCEAESIPAGYEGRTA